ncbi:MAG: hypothetical protein ACNA7O_00235 [Rhodobacterales bacterium]
MPKHVKAANEDTQAQLENPALAMGLNGIADWSTQHPFIDILKTSRSWTGHLTGRFGGFEADALQEGGYIDDEGWPRAVPRGVEALEAFVLTEQPAEGQSVAGRYVLSYEGIGRVQVTGPVSNVRYRDGDIHFTFTPSDGLVGVRVNRIDPAGTGDHVRNIRIVREDHLQLDALGYRFNPDWLEKIRDVRVLRFMDWMATNNSGQVTWADRPRVEDATFTTHGVPVEIMVELANEAGVDAWFTLPHMVDDDYVRQFASYVRDHLNPDLKAYVEYSNEVWNWQFAQATWAAEQARARWGEDVGDGWVQFAGLRAAQMAQIWTDVFGAEAEERLVRVVATQTGWLGLEEGLLHAPRWQAEDSANRPPFESFDAYAVTGYFGVGGDADEHSNRILGWLDQGEDYATERLLEELRNDSVASLINRYFPYHADVAEKHGLDLIMYEGGTHVVGFANWTENQRLTDFYTSFNYTEGVAELYREVLDGWHAAGGTLFNAFVDVSKPSRWGSWGHLRHLDDMNPRWQALMEYNEATLVDWERRAPNTFSHGTIRHAPVEGGRVEAQHPRDVLLGGPGDDILVATGCCPRIHGGDGRNVAVLPEAAVDYELIRNGDVLTVRTASGEGRMVNIEEIRFSGGTSEEIVLFSDMKPEQTE